MLLLSEDASQYASHGGRETIEKGSITSARRRPGVGRRKGVYGSLSWSDRCHNIVRQQLNRKESRRASISTISMQAIQAPGVVSSAHLVCHISPKPREVLDELLEALAQHHS